MVSAKVLLHATESIVLATSSLTPRERIELMHTIRSSLPSLQSLLSYPVPKASDRSQVQSKEVRLADSPPISLDDQDVQIALKLSDDLHLNEIDCVRLLVATNQERGMLDREPLEILRIATGIWYTERRDLLAALFNLLRAVVLDQGHEADLIAEIQKYLENLINAGLRQRIMTLIKELNREEPAGLGGPHSEQHIIDSRSALLERRAVVCRERLLLCHCLVLSAFVVRMGPKEVKDVLSLLKDCATDVNGSSATQKLQIALGLLFSLVTTFISDALSTVPDKASTLAGDTSFRREFHELVIAVGNDPNVEGFVDVTRLAWAVHLMLTQDGLTTRETIAGSSSSELANIFSCLEVICSSNVFQFLLDKVLRTAAYQHDDEDMIYMYNAYMHKLMTCFLSHPLARDKVKEMKEKAMSALSAYPMTGLHDVKLDNDMDSQQTIENSPQPFVSLLELVSEIYQKEPHLLSDNEVLWTFVNFAGEDHTNVLTLVAFLKMLSTLASSQEGASKVWELLQGKTFRSVGWSTLFDCLSIYEERFRQSHQNSGTMLPEFEEGDAKALVAYLNVLQKVVENGNPNERKNWFPDIEPLFKLLSYENVPSYLKGALRNAIRVFIPVSPALKDTIWRYLEQYDLPVVVGPSSGSSVQQMSTQVYDMRFELNEVESRMEKYPSTISFLNLLNALIAEERDVSDRGRRFLGIFRFVYDHVFGPFPQRAYADLSEKWQLVVVCLQHFKMILGMYDLEDEDIDNVVHLSQSSAQSQSTPLETQVPVLELLKDFMSGRAIFRNIMGILLPGVNGLIDDRTTQIYGHLLENAVQLSLEIIILVLEKDLFVADFWRPLYQPLDRILSQDQNQVVALLEYVRYDFQPLIQQSSIKIMSILSSRMVGLVPLLLKSNAAQSLIEDYAACLELRSEESQAIEDTKDDIGVLIIELLIDNINRPPPNITHLLLKFHVDMSVERTVLQPKFHYSCLKVILDILENLSKPEVNALLHEFGLKLLYELCTDPLTSGPTMDLLSNKRYQFFLKHLYTIGVSALPKRNNNQVLRISSLHQRAWLLKLLALELHVGDMTASAHRETCLSILGHLFAQSISDFGSDLYLPKHSSFQTNVDHPGIKSISKIKVLELLEVVQFRCPDTSMKSSQLVSSLKYELPVENILGDPATSEKGGVYHFSERGDRLINLASFCDKLWQKSKFVNPAMSSVGGEADVMDLRETIQVLIRWGWKYNKNLEEQAAQLHMLTSWSQIVEVTVSRRMTFLEDRSEILFEVLDASLSASASPDCSLKMASLLTQVSLTCMARLRDERFLSPGGMNSDNLTCLDVLLVKQLSNGACHSILFKLIMAILRPESSEALRRRQYALLLSYFQYCRHMLDPDVPATVLQFLLREEQDSEEDLDMKKIDKEQSELAQANFSILRKEAQAILNLVTKDAIQGSEAGKTVAFYVLDALISIDQERFFLGQLQSRGFLRSCLTDISNISSQRGFTLEAELAMLLRISHSYGKPGAQVLFSMGAIEHLTSCKMMGLQLKGGFNRAEAKGGRDVAMEIQKQRCAICSILRLVFSLTCLVDTSEFFEVKNKIVREVIDFVKGHQLLFDQVIREDVSKADELTMEQINLVVSILSKVWPYEENDEYGFVQGLFGMMSNIFTLDAASCFSQSLTIAHQKQRTSELIFFRISFSLSSYLYFLVTKKSLRLQVSEDASDYRVPNAERPRLSYLVRLLNSVTVALDRAAEEKSALLNKIRDINELSRQEVDEIISMCVRQDCVSSTDNIQKRRYIAMVEMCQIAGNRDQLITLLLPLAEHVLNIFLVHFRERYSPQGPSIPDSSDATKMISYGKQEPNQDISLLCAKLLPVLERLELLNEDKTGHSLKIFRRLLCSLKEMTIQRLST
ncbi:nuclear pore complex protein NUP205-like isoform X1 [Papaver somniferum]|uniref:nuclear pore complex protein NUP205-like isoform X1 n=1 Tax=Papaver somniferum TaxID=3469 RepID=UPI000E703FB3|nr:nuclear pore complex protein NUP205-like isoform X1 [Papaver somniferum]